jgi:hypothetical protein
MRDQRRGSAVACLLRLWTRIPPRHGCFLCVLCIVRGRSLRRVDYSSRGGLLSALSDLETSTVRRPSPTRRCRAMGKKQDNDQKIDPDWFHFSFIT